MSGPEIHDEVAELAEMVEEGLITETELEKMYNSSSQHSRHEDSDVNDDADELDAFVIAKLEEEKRLNEELRAKMDELTRDEHAAPTQQTRGRRSSKPVVSKGVVIGAPRRSGTHRPNLSHTTQESRRIERDNMHLLSRLNSINRKGGQTSTFQASAKSRHMSTSGQNRLSSQRKIENQNLKFVRRLQSVKSTMPTGTRSTAAPLPRRRAQPKSRPVKKKPEWVDVAGVGLM